jgi:hypothetical protein
MSSHEEKLYTPRGSLIAPDLLVLGRNASQNPVCEIRSPVTSPNTERSSESRAFSTPRDRQWPSPRKPKVVLSDRRRDGGDKAKRNARDICETSEGTVPMISERRDGRTGLHRSSGVPSASDGSALGLYPNPASTASRHKRIPVLPLVSLECSSRAEITRPTWYPMDKEGVSQISSSENAKISGDYDEDESVVEADCFTTRDYW